MHQQADADYNERARLYLRYLVEKGAVGRWGWDWEITDPRRRPRLEEELSVIEGAGFQAAFVMLADILGFCRREGIPYGPGRGSVGGSLTAYALGIHEVDSLRWGLLFERFLNANRVSFPDVDIDVSQRHRDRVLGYIRDTYQRDGQVVLQVAAFARASGRSVIDTMRDALSHKDPEAGAVAEMLKKCLPDKGSITGGVKVQRELAWWRENGHGDKKAFNSLAEQTGWLEHMLKLDGMYTHLAKHAAGVVILDEQDLRRIPQTSADHETMMTGFDMYDLDDLGYLKWDILGLRTIDVLSDADRMSGGDGTTASLMRIWEEHRDDPAQYESLGEGDTLGIFQMETPGYRRTLSAFKPTCFDHIVQLVALYRPGALDFKETLPDGSEGRNMVEVFIDRHRGKEDATFDHPSLEPILRQTHGIMIYQEQQMQVAMAFGFDARQADELRKSIGKKRPEDMAKLGPIWEAGTKRVGVQDAVRDRVWKNMEAAARYSWNKSHAVEYGVITQLTAWFRHHKTAAYVASLLNSYEGDKERMAEAIAWARKSTAIRPPDVNVALDGFTVDDGDIVFGLNGIKGMGDANRNAILVERALYGPFVDYADFCRRLPSVPTNMKASLVACGAFDALGGDRLRLLAECPKGDPFYTITLACGCESRRKQERLVGEELRCPTHGPYSVVSCRPGERKRWRVLEKVNEDAKRELEGKPPKPDPDLLDMTLPSDSDLAAGELEAMGFYISNVPLRAVAEDLARYSPSNTTGGEVASVKLHNDKRGDEMATLQLITPELTRQRVRIFASNWHRLRHRVVKGAQLLMRGEADSDTFLAADAWVPGDYRHVRSVKLTKGDERTTSKLQEELTEERVRQYEDAGYVVRFL